MCVNCIHESEEGKNESRKIRCAGNGIRMVVIWRLRKVCLSHEDYFHVRKAIIFLRLEFFLKA